MLGKTHLFFGVTSTAAITLAVAPHIQAIPLIEAVLAGAIGSLLPDLDEPGSTISNSPRILGAFAQRTLHRTTKGAPAQGIIRLAGWLIGALATLLNIFSRILSHVTRAVAFGHREGTHWIPIAIGVFAGVFLLTSPALGFALGLGFAIGYTSHLLTDACTKAGIPLLPGSRKRLRVFPRAISIRTGSAGETLFASIYAVALAVVEISRAIGHPLLFPS